MSLSTLIKSSVQKARSQLGDLAISFVVMRKTGTSYINGKNTPTFRNVDVTGVHDKFEHHEVDGNVVRVTDNKIMLFIDSNDQVPQHDDLLVDGATTYQVIKAQPIYAGSQVVLAMVHARV